MPAGDAEAEQPGAGERRKRNRKRWKTDEKKLLTTPCRCDSLYRLSLEADREGSETAEKKIKKFLTKRNGFDKISKLSRGKNDRNLDN